MCGSSETGVATHRRGVPPLSSFFGSHCYTSCSAAYFLHVRRFVSRSRDGSSAEVRTLGVVDSRLDYSTAGPKPFDCHMVPVDNALCWQTLVGCCPMLHSLPHVALRYLGELSKFVLAEVAHT